MNNLTCIYISNNCYKIKDETGNVINVPKDKLINTIKSGRVSISNLALVNDDIQVIGAVQATVVNKVIDKYGTVITYTIEDTSGTQMVVSTESLKEAIKNLKINIDNLILTSNDHLRIKKEPAPVVKPTHVPVVQPVQTPVIQPEVKVQAPVVTEEASKKHKETKKRPIESFFVDKGLNVKAQELDKRIMVQGLGDKKTHLLEYKDNMIISANVHYFEDTVRIALLLATSKLGTTQEEIRTNIYDYAKDNMDDIKIACARIIKFFIKINRYQFVKFRSENMRIIYPELELSYRLIS